MTDKRLQKRIMDKRRRRKKELQKKAYSWILTALFVVLFYAIICAAVGNRCLYKNTTINGVDVGGMKAADAAERINKELINEYKELSIGVMLDSEQYLVDVSAAADMDVTETIEEIQNKSHSFWRRGYGLLESIVAGGSYTVFPKADSRELVIASIQNSPLMQVELKSGPGYTIDGDRLLIVKGKGNMAVDQERLADDILQLMKEGAYDRVLSCPVKDCDVDIDRLYDDICCMAREPGLDPENGYTVVEAADGVEFDINEAKQLMSTAKDGDTVVIPLTFIKPELSTKEYEELLFRDVMGECTTIVEGSENRKTNVEMAAKYCDGTILLPGESFSYNYGVGELTEERGFLPGPSYANGESVLDMGGGICQVSSTMYMACLYANLQIDERHCHPYPASYVPAGFDATVAWGGCDFIFTNDTEYPIRIDTTYDGYSTSCTIWGTIEEPFSVELYSETVETEPFETKYELDKSLGKDEQILDTVGIEGLTIKSYRRVYDQNGEVVSDSLEATSVYSKRDEIYRVGKLPKKEKKDETSTEKTSEKAND